MNASLLPYPHRTGAESKQRCSPQSSLVMSCGSGSYFENAARCNSNFSRESLFFLFFFFVILFFIFPYLVFSLLSSISSCHGQIDLIIFYFLIHTWLHECCLVTRESVNWSTWSLFTLFCEFSENEKSVLCYSYLCLWYKNSNISDKNDSTHKNVNCIRNKNFIFF